MRESLIKWKKDDISNLRKSVNEFNRRVSELESYGREIVPKKLDYKTIKAEIYTRNELNRQLREMKLLNKSSMADIITLESGQKITRFELVQLTRAKNRATKRLTSELASLEASTPYGMGNKEINEIQSTLESLGKIGTKKGYDFSEARQRAMRLGVLGYDLKKAKIFQENFIKAYRKMRRKEIVEFAQSFRNPMDFWNAIKDSRLIDIEERYDNEQGMISFASSTSDIYYDELDKLGIKYEKRRQRRKPLTFKTEAQKRELEKIKYL